MIETIGSATEPPASAGASNTLGGLGSEAFLNLLVAQMRYQNPMAPADGAAMLQQTAQFTTVETLQAISEANQRLMGLQEVGMALAVVGKDVSALAVDGTRIDATVDGVRFTIDGPMLQLDGREVPLDNVLQVSQAADAPAGGSEPTTGGDPTANAGGDA